MQLSVFSVRVGMVYVKLISSASRRGRVFRSILSMPSAMWSVIPPAWAAANLSDPGQILAAGGDWAQYGHGPSLFAYNPASFDVNSNHDSGTALLEYDAANPVNDVDMDDLWLGGAWVELGGESLALIGGSKDITNMGNDAAAPDDLHGWILAYDPSELGVLAPNLVQPVADWDIDDLMFTGQGIKSMAYDRADNILYAVESISSNTPVHVWHVVPEPLAGCMLLAGAVSILRRRRR